jgi:SAM-dependent methyltransferase
VDSSCPICTTAFGEHWLLLSRRARHEEPIESRICPRCTLVRTGGCLPRDNDASFYRARVYAGAPASMLVEDAHGRIAAPKEHDHRSRLRERVLAMRHALAAASVDLRPSILHVGSGDGMLLAVARSVFGGADVLGLEPWQPWRAAARQRDVPTAAATLETWPTERKFDVVLDLDLLPHLPDPVAHLRAIAHRLHGSGVAMIAVPNLLGVTGDLAGDVLRGDSPHGFTPRALATACRRAGLLPFVITAGPELRMLCRREEVSEAIVAGPDAMSVAHGAWGNDLRLSIKRALAEHGPTPRLLRTAAVVHRRCPSPSARADIAIEIAVHCERCSDYEQAAAWLVRSLDDRADAEVEATLGQLRGVIESVRAAWAGATALDATEPVRLAS